MRILDMMRAILAGILIALCNLAYAEEEPLPDLIVTREGQMYWGRVLSQDVLGVMVTFMNHEQPVRFYWDDLSRGSRRELQGQNKKKAEDGFEAEMAEALEIKLRNGSRPIIGTEVTNKSNNTQLVLRSRWGEMTFKKDKIETCRVVVVPAKMLYSAKDRYWRYIRSTPPKTAKDHLLASIFAEENGLLKEARKHCEKALEKEPGSKDAVQSRLVGLENAQAEKTADLLYAQAQKAAAAKAYPLFHKKSDELFARFPASNATTRMADLFDKIDQEYDQWLNQRVPYIWRLNMKKVAHDAARLPDTLLERLCGFARNRMKDEITRKTATDLEISKQRVEEKMAVRHLSPNRHSYGTSSWLVESPTSGNTQTWWNKATIAMRKDYLVGICIEANFQIIRVTYTDCPKCNGSGNIIPEQDILQFGSKKEKITFGDPDWEDRCPRCYGQAKDRVIIFK